MKITIINYGQKFLKQLFKLFYIYLREHKQGRGRERIRAGPALAGQNLMQGWNSWTMRSCPIPKPKSWMLYLRSLPGTPKNNYLKARRVSKSRQKLERIWLVGKNNNNNKHIHWIRSKSMWLVQWRHSSQHGMWCDWIVSRKLLSS